MERKVSNISEQSHSSSVVIQPQFNGLGKKTIQNLISQQSSPPPQSSQPLPPKPFEHFPQQKDKAPIEHFKVSTFDNNYNDHNLTSISHHNPYQHNEQQQQTKQEDSDNEFDETIDLDKSISGIIDVDSNDHEVEEEEYDDDDDEEEEELDEEDEEDDDNSDSYREDPDDDYNNYVDNDYEPASPPRSPPRDLDADKLYGLYEFSGPDPSHCSLQIDEPVYLVNDQDSYWWLIKKLSKRERKERMRNLDLSHEDVESDDEDGKIGFVPAECLETYAERLARLNCFKNEELEKLHHQESADSLKKPSPTNLNKKSVTFENLGDIIDEYSDEEPRNDHDDIRHNLQFYNDLGAIKPLHPHPHQQVEVLSDTYSNEPPLIVPKNKSNNNKTTITVTPTLQPSNVFDDLYVQPKHQANTVYDDISIGSYSPDTPRKGKSPLRTEIEDDDDQEGDGDIVARTNSLSSLRRSVILDRLTQVTSDIQEQLQLEDSDEEEDEEEDDDDEPTVHHETTPKHRPTKEIGDFSFEEESIINDHTPEGSKHESDEDQYTPIQKFSTFSPTLQRLLSTPSHSTSPPSVSQIPSPNSSRMSSSTHYSISDLSYSRLPKSSTSIDEESSAEENNDESITPLTSMNSLTPIDERRKSRPLHEMFIPILGKFDELAEKLAELDDILK
ncbi:hypothetical protein G210_2126 [Candida maltosa Xu316]|uniref:SH3 domain-containing protein n=1 Tax=Candida maltosa (strain Xu316) TaxID=1245528 RepID=M3JEH0_CANMX|nr:hypothetical protein G210_2126 [Candida maltosa Xu316]